MPNTKTFLRRFAFVLLLIVALSQTASAQRTRSSETDLLRRTEVHQELGLSEDLSKKLEELQAKSNPTREDFEANRKALEGAGSEEEKKKIRDAFSDNIIKSRTLFQDNALTLLSDTQRGQLRGLFLKNAGPRGLTNDEVAAEYGLTEEQKTKLAEVAGLQRDASRSLATDITDVDRAKFDADWHNKHLAVLTAEQKSRFEKELAQAPSRQESVVQGGPPTPGNSAATTPAVPAREMSTAPPEGETAVLSFGAGSAPGERKIIEEFSFNFRHAPWEQVLQMFADGTDLTLDVIKLPPGSFSHLDDKKYNAKQALDIINGYLIRKGFGMFQKEGFLIVINLDDGIPPSLLRDVSVEELISVNELLVGNNELVNVTIEVLDMDTAKAAQEIEALIGPWGSMIALTESQLLILTDIGSNLRRIHGLLTSAMSKSKPDAQMFKMYFVKHMDAEEAQIAVMTQFGMRQNVANVSYGVEQQSRTQQRTRTGTPTPATSAKPEPEVQVASDLRLNSLLVTGTTKQHLLVEQILTSIDVDEDQNGDTISRSRRGTYLEVYQVKTADAGEVTKTISAMNIPGVQVVNEDRRTGRIHIMATEKQHEEVAALVRQLDGTGSIGSVSVIQLHQMDPLSAAATLRSLFYADGDEAPTIETDLYGRRLIVRGSIEHITQIKQVLADLGETGGPRVRESGKVRSVPLQGRDPEKFLRILKSQWEQEEVSRLNILIPDEDGPVKSRQTSEGELPTNQLPSEKAPPEQSAAEDDSVTSTLKLKPWGQWTTPSNSVEMESTPKHIPVRSGAVPQEDDNTTTEQSDAAAADPPITKQPSDAAGETMVEVIVIGDELILSSRDEEELDRLEDLMDRLQQTLPFKQEFTQYFLKSADALEASDMLSQFFPSSSVASTSSASGGSILGSLTSGFGSLGSNLMDATGLSGLGASSNSLKIIPDIRTNSLFLAGPPMMVKDSISLLKVLDSNDGPESLKDMQARTIIVNHADVNDVKSMLDDLFKTYLEAQGQARGQQQQNPLAAMFGGGGGGGGRGGNNEVTQVRMHLAVDQQNSLILVNSSQDLFAEVEKVVTGLDTAAKDANRLIRVIQLKNADASLIQQSLTSLLPRVSVSASRTNSSSSSSSSGGSNNDDNKASDNAAAAQQEAFNRAMQERARQRTGAGGGGGQTATPGGGRGGFGQPGGGRTGGGGFGGFGGTPRGGR